MLITLLAFILILGILVFVHELGHFLSAKKMGVAVEEFGFGFPPRIFGLKRKGTTYSLNLIPLGGFVKIKGESGEKKEEKDSFAHKKIWQRSFILGSGVASNLLLAVIILSLGFYLGLPTIVDSEIKGAKIKEEKIQIISVLENSPAGTSSLKPGDEIISIDNLKISEIEELQKYNADKIGQQINLQIKRGNDLLNKKVGVVDLNNDGQGVMGVNLAKTALVAFPWYQAIFMGAKTTLLLISQIILALYDLIKNLIIAKPVNLDVTGPVGIAVLTGQVAQMGFIYLLEFTALLSINLAIINFIPFPALDGGRIFFLTIEKLRGKALNGKLESVIHNIGFAILILLIIVVTLKDVNRFRDSLTAFFHNLVGG